MFGNGILDQIANGLFSRFGNTPGQGGILQNIANGAAFAPGSNGQTMPQTESGGILDAIARHGYQGALAGGPDTFMPSATTPSGGFAARYTDPVTPIPLPSVAGSGASNSYLKPVLYASSDANTASPPASAPQPQLVDHNIAGPNSISPDRAMAWSADNGKTINILHPDNSVETRTGGSPSWRSNSPGNVAVARDPEIGSYSVPLKNPDGTTYIQRHAIFDNAQAGMDSLWRQFFAPKSMYPGMTIEQAMNKYASPEAGNNTEAYINDLVRATGLDRQTVLNSFNGQQRAKWLNGVQRHEGWTPNPSGVKWE